MAVLHARHNKNRKKRAGLIALMILSVLAAAGTFAAVSWYSMEHQAVPPFGAAAVLIVAMPCAAYFAACRRKSAILKSGIDGEQQAVSVLKKLPDAYQILANPVFSIHGKEVELDALVIGPNGVFIVETKNHSGRITGKTDDEFWRQEKRSETKQMKNPLMQLERQVRLVRRMLSDLNVKCPVRGYVYFANPNAEIRVEDERIFTDGASVCKAVRNEKGGGVMPKPAKLARCLLKQCR